MFKRAIVGPLFLTTLFAYHVSAQQQSSRPTAPPPPTFGGAPHVSPDGSRILYHTIVDGAARLRIMNVDGSGQRQFGPDTLNAFGGQWSPDGKMVMGANRTGAILLDADGSKLRAFPIAKPGAMGFNWASDGRVFYIVGKFAPGTFPVANIRIVNADGSADAAVTADSALNMDPTLSPDGRTVAFARVVRGRPGKIFLKSLDGTERQLSSGPTSDQWPVWSPDGRYIAFQANNGPGQGTQIGLVEVRTGVQRMLTRNGPGRNDETPSWFPDGKRLAIQSDRDAAWNAYVIDLQGNTLAQLTRAR